MKKRKAKIMAAMLSLSLTASIGAPMLVNAATEHWNDASVATTTSDASASWTQWKADWASYSSNYENVSLTPGEDESELNFAWYSHTVEKPQVRIAKRADMRYAVLFQESESTQVETNVACSIEGGTANYMSNKVTVDGLKENTQYYYQVYQNGAWQDVQSYKTGDASAFSFLYVGDPQIGASSGQTSSENDAMSSNNYAARNDGYNWNEVLNNALKAHTNISFMVSAGDQVNTATNEIQYAAYLGADALSSLPVATTIGNHDSSAVNYTNHYNNPNSDAVAADSSTSQGKTAAGTDYYYTYGDVLFIVLDTNNYNCATHQNVIDQAVKENPDAKWRVVTFHQDIYGSGYDHSDSDGIVLRTQLTPIFDAYDIDVVLQGHDHTYSRTYQLTSDGAQHASYTSSPVKRGDTVSGTPLTEEKQAYLDNNNCYTITSDTASGTITNPEGTVYMEANSATGSKFYNLIASQQDYIAERSQTWTPSYSVIDVTDSTFTITTYDASTSEELNGSSSYTIEKTDAKAAQTITGTDSYEKKVTDKAFTLDAKASGKLTYESDNEDVAVVSKSGKVTITGTGTANITVSAAATDTQEAATKTVTVKVAAADKVAAAQTISVSKTAVTKAYGAKAFTLGAKTNGNGTLSFVTSNKNVATVNSKGIVSIKGIGTATITVKAAATTDYKAAAKTVKITVYPKQAKISSLKSTKTKQAKVVWAKDSKASGYQVVYAANKTFTKNATTVTVNKNNTTSKTITKLTKGKKLYVKVRAYKTVNGKKMYGAYSTVKTVTVK